MFLVTFELVMDSRGVSAYADSFALRETVLGIGCQKSEPLFLR